MVLLTLLYSQICTETVLVQGHLFKCLSDLLSKVALSFQKEMFKFTAYLCNQEVDIFLDKDIDLFHEDGLDLLLGLAAEVCRGLRDSTCHQSVTLIGHLSGQVTSCFVYLASLWMKGNIF